MKTRFLAFVAVITVFLGLAAVITGLTLLLSPHGSDDQLIAIVLLAGGLTYFWKRSGFRGLK
jgi:hypothetical protein